MKLNKRFSNDLESNYKITALVSPLLSSIIGLKSFKPIRAKTLFSQPIRCNKTKTIHGFGLHDFSRACHPLHVFALSFDWLVVQFMGVVIGCDEYGVRVTTVTGKPLETLTIANLKGED